MNHPRRIVAAFGLCSAASLALYVLSLGGGVLAPVTPVADAPAAKSKTPTRYAGTSPSSWPGSGLVEVAPEGSHAFTPPERTWFDDRVMVRVSGDPGALAAKVGTELMRSPGPSGIVSMRVPDGVSRDAFLATLARQPEVEAATRVGAVYGAGKKSKDTTAPETTTKSEWTATYGALQWHRDQANVDDSLTYNLKDVIVAVVDSGVAFEDYSDASGTYVALPGLSSSHFLNEYDFVNDDTHPNDDNQHGTHIACLIACTGDTLGIAPEAKIMPIKVLDANLEGDETALIDGIWHAIDNGAHVINLSLSFAPAYAPSAELLEALEEAYDEGILVVAAAGNWAGSQATWPARSPLVMGVAAGELDPDTYDSSAPSTGAIMVASYTNLGTGVSLTAPGGNLDVDLNGDGLGDGLLAETIDPDDPSRTGLWLMAGSSQAAALVSGTALHVYAQGGTRQMAWGAILDGAGSMSGDSGVAEGAGVGRLKTKNAASKLYGNAASQTVEHFVNFVPYLVDNGDGTVTPTALVHAVDSDGSYTEAEIYVSFHGASDSVSSCKPGDASGCLVSGEAVSTTAADGTEAELWWSVQVDGVERNGALWPAFSSVYTSDALNAAIVAIEDYEDGHAPLGWYWEDGTDADLGDLAEAGAFLDQGSGFASSPMGLLFNAKALNTWFTIEEVDLDLDGSGFASSPMGVSSARFARGSGFASSPMGVSRVAMLRGSGFASSPMGTAVATLSDATNGTFFPLDAASLSKGESRTPLGEVVTTGGWLLSTGAPVAAVIGASLEGDAHTTVEANSTSSTEYSE